jgi:SWI/SNF-related matrix-associated actin-dependent regulator 1 of chromatin subfamily A
MSKKLLPHQLEDAAFLASKAFAGNFSGMGSGKTLTALAAVEQVADLALDTILIVGPPISLNMWVEEFEDFCQGYAQILKASKTKIDGRAQALVMSYEIATKRRDELKELRAKVLICDESHALKNHTAKRTKAIIGRHGICESVEHTWLLTGTPSTRWNDDLYTFMCRAGNGQLREKIGKIDMSRFRLRYCVTQKKKFSAAQRFPVEVTVGNRNTTELNELLFEGGMAVRRELADVWKQMTPLTINRLQVSLDKSPELTAILKTVKDKTMDEMRQDMAAGEEHIATLRRMLGMAKVKHSVSEIADRVEAGVKPILVGAWHRDVIDELAKGLRSKGIKVAVIDGRTGSLHRNVAIKDFNEGTLDVLVGQIGAMGVSLNLQGGSHIIVVEEDWSPSVMSQFYSRCHRLGQADHVHVDIFASDTKLDQAVARISSAKRRGHATAMAQEAAQ